MSRKRDLPGLPGQTGVRAVVEFIAAIVSTDSNAIVTVRSTDLAELGSVSGGTSCHVRRPSSVMEVSAPRSRVCDSALTCADAAGAVSLLVTQDQEGT